MKPIQSSACKGNPFQKIQHLPDYSGRELFVGIDVHKQRWQVAVIFDNLLLSNTSIEGSAQALIRHLNKYYPHADLHCVYECGPFGFTLCRTLNAKGIHCIVVNPADIPETHREQKSKTDPVDARKLARHLAAGLLQPVHVPSEKLQKQRSLIRFRKKLWGDLVRAKNRLKSELVFHGIIIPLKYDNPHWSHNFLSWIEQQVQDDPDLKDTILLMLEEVRLLRTLLLKTEKKLRLLMRSEDFDHASTLLRSITGIGPLTAMLFLLEVGDINRFKSFDALNRFVGFCPDAHSSGQSLRHTGITVRRHNQLRTMIIESAWQLIRRDPALMDHYRELTKRMKGQQAITRIARKLLRRIRAVMISNRIYVNGVSGKLTSADIDAPPIHARKKTRNN